MTHEEIVELGKKAGFTLAEIICVDAELHRFAELVQGQIVKELLRTSSGYIIYTPCALH